MERIHVVSSAAKNPSIIRRSFRRTIFFIIAILAIGSTFEPYNQAQLAVVLIYFIGVLSVTILTGISGQISLGQGALMAVGDVIITWLLLRQADIAAEKLAAGAGKDTDFYTGKIAAAKFFVHNNLPHITADRKIVEGTDSAIMEISENAF